MEHTETPSPFTETGAKGVGERGGMIDAPASIATSINAALDPLSVEEPAESDPGRPGPPPEEAPRVRAVADSASPLPFVRCSVRTLRTDRSRTLRTERQCCPEQHDSAAPSGEWTFSPQPSERTA